MSQNKRNNARKDKTRCDIGIEHICGFLRFIWVACKGLEKKDKELKEREAMLKNKAKLKPNELGRQEQS